MKKLLLSLCLAMAAFGASNAAEVTITPTTLPGESGSISWSAEKQNGGTDPTYTGTDLRVYAKGTFTITSNTELEKIVFNISTQGKKRLAPITASIGEIAAQTKGDETVTWTGSSKSVTLTVGDKADFGSDGSSKAGQFCFTSFVVTTTESGTLLRDAEISFPQTAYTAMLGEEFESPMVSNPNGLPLTYTSLNEEVATVGANGELTILSAGKTTITATSEETEEFAAGKAEYILTVKDPSAKTVTDSLTSEINGGSGTGYNPFADKKYNSQALYAGRTAKGNNAIQLNDSNTAGIYTTKSGGKVVSISLKWNTNNDDRTVDIYGRNTPYDKVEKVAGEKIGSASTGTTEVELSANPKYILIVSNKNALYLDQIEITWEEDNTSVDPTPDLEEAGLSFGEQTALTAVLGEAFEAPALTNPNNLAVKYASSDANVATVDEEGNVTITGIGEATITATSAATEQFAAGEAQYTITVKPADGNFITSIVFNDNGYTNAENITEILLGDIKLTVDKNGGTGFAYYSNGTAARLYAKCAITFAGVTENIRIKSVKFLTGSSYKTFLDETKVSEGTFDATENIWTGFANQFVLTQGGTSGQTRIQSIEIQYVVAPALPVVNGSTKPGSTIELKKDEDTVIIIEVAEGENLHVQEVAANAAARIAAADVDLTDGTWRHLNTNGETRVEYTVPTDVKEISFVAEKNGVLSNPHTLTVTDGTLTGVEAIEAESAEAAEWFTLQGVRVATPTEGLYIRRTGNKVEKVTVK